MNLWLQKYFSPILSKLWVCTSSTTKILSCVFDYTPCLTKKKSLSWDQTGELTIFNWEKLFCGDIIFPTAHTLLVVFELRCSSPPKSLYIHKSYLVFPKLFFCKQLSLVVNKQGQRTMKMAIKIFLTFQLF